MIEFEDIRLSLIHILVSLLRKAAGIICEDLGDNAAIIGMALDIPVITGAHGATKILKSGTVVTMDGAHGHVYSGLA